MKWTVFQPILTTEQIVEINDSDAADQDFYKAYRDVTMLFNEGVAKKVRMAYEEGLYRKNYIVETAHLTNLFPILNGMSDGTEKVELVGKLRKSMSVGDVAVGSNGEVWVCDSLGYTELPDTLANEFVEAAA